MTERRASKPRGTPNFDPRRSVMARTVIFHIIKEMTTMIYDLEIHIEELRAELRNADPAERAQIEADLEQARSELAAMTAAAERRNAPPC